MAITTLEEIRCACGEVFESEVYQSVSAQKNPELKEAILSGEFNIVFCTECKQPLHVDKMLLYHDADQQLLAFVYPKDLQAKKEEFTKNMQQNFVDLQASLVEDERFAYKPFLIFGLDDLCTLIRLEEEIEIESEIAESLCGVLGLSFKKIHLDSARRKNMMPLLPYVPGASGDFKMQIIEGLKEMLETNPLLAQYKKLLDHLESGAAVELEDSDFVV